jgi:hypothetical protein
VNSGGNWNNFFVSVTIFGWLADLGVVPPVNYGHGLSSFQLFILFSNAPLVFEIVRKALQLIHSQDFVSTGRNATLS